MKRLIISVSILFLVIVSTIAQEKISVRLKVIDASDGNYIDWMAISILDENKNQTKEFILTEGADEKGYVSFDINPNYYLLLNLIGYEKKILPINNQKELEIIMLPLESSLPLEFYHRNCFTFGGIATIHNGTWGYALDASVNMRYWSTWKHRDVIKDRLSGSYGLYNEIMKRSTIGVNLTKLDPSDNKLLTSLYYRFTYTIPIKKYHANLNIFASAGLYLDVDRREIQYQNLEYGGGIIVWDWQNFIPINKIKRSDFLRNIKLLGGYRGYNKRSEYNHFYLGLSFTFPQKVIIYE